MCRLAAYLGPEIFISSLVTEPRHSIIHQSYHSKEREEPLNGDGFGISWFAPQICESPAVFKEVSPAWNNQNLKNIARVTKSSCIFAHVRAATVGGQVSRSNCHPFSWKRYAFMHNGTVYGFDKIRRRLCESLSDEAYNIISGRTDSEHIFALFADQIKGKENPSAFDIGQSLIGAIKKIEEFKQKAGIEKPSTLNLVVSDGHSLIATRYVSKGENSNSLYFFKGESFSCKDGICQIKKGSNSFLIASEPLSESQEWESVLNNNFVVVDQNMNVKMNPIEFTY